MNKQAFLEKLKRGLSRLPQDELEERLAFYNEMIEDRMEEGLTEEEAVLAVGSVEEITSQIVSDTPLTKLVKENCKPKRRLKVWEIVLLMLGSPIWISLLITALAVLFVLYICLWTGIISLWTGFIALVVCGFAGVTAGVIISLTGNGTSGLAAIGAGTVCAGLSIFLFLGCKAITQGILTLTKRMALSIKNQLIKKEETK